MAIQTVARRDAYKQAAQARRLIAQTNIAPHILRSTMDLGNCVIPEPIIVCQAKSGGMKCGKMEVEAGTTFYLIASKFIGRAYTVALVDGQWQCSAEDERAARHCIKEVIAYRKSLPEASTRRMAAQAILDQLNAAESDLDAASAAKDWKAYDDAYWRQQANVKQLVIMGFPPIMTSRGWNI